MNSTSFNLASLSQAIGKQLRLHRAAVMREERIHDSIAQAFAELGIQVEREYRLTKSSRLDFFVPDSGTVVEVKKGNIGVDVLHQVGRYFESPEVTGCILIGMRFDARMPSKFAGKPIAAIALWKYLL
jgi:hypothetical protein